MLPRLAILGRPNVGKSSLFNRLAGKRISIVDPTPGVTRDRISASILLKPTHGGARAIEVIDTGGWGVYTTDKNRIDDAGKDLTSLTADIENQIMAAAAAADVIMFTVDVRDGVMALDRTVAELLRKRGFAKKTMLVANKADDRSLEAAAQEGARLGFGAPLCVSAMSGNGIARLRDVICGRLPKREDETDEVLPGSDLGIAIVGRRNAGKSSIVNQLAGEPRVIVSEIAGTTRDSVDVRIDMQGRAITLIDTAGIRKRKSWAGDIEFYANTRTTDAIARCDVAWLLLDATEKSSQIEKQLAGQLHEGFKPTILVVNKWDLVEKKRKPADYQKYLTQEFPGLEFAPICFVSAHSGIGLREAVAMSFSLRDQANHREGTGRVNAAVRRILEMRGPSSKLGTKAKVFYVSQIAINPPTIAMVVNKPDLFAGQYERYFLNRLREELPFSEVPIKLQFSARRRWQDGGGGPPPKVRAEDTGDSNFELEIVQGVDDTMDGGHTPTLAPPPKHTRPYAKSAPKRAQKIWKSREDRAVQRQNKRPPHKPQLAQGESGAQVSDEPQVSTRPTRGRGAKLPSVRTKAAMRERSEAPTRGRSSRAIEAREEMASQKRDTKAPGRRDVGRDAPRGAKTKSDARSDAKPATRSGSRSSDRSTAKPRNRSDAKRDFGAARKKPNGKRPPRR